MLAPISLYLSITPHLNYLISLRYSTGLAITASFLYTATVSKLLFRRYDP